MTQTGRLGELTVRRMGFGAMQLPGRGVMGPPRDRGQALSVLRRAVELGVDHIDTAQYYGPDVANELIREALHPYPGLTLVSKVGARRDAKGGWLPWDRPEDLRQGIEDNLASLGVERLGAVNLRLMDTPGGVPFDEQLDAMVQARDDGLIAGVGLSNVTADQLAHALTRTAVACVQNPYNLIDRSSQPVLELCEREGIAFVPFFPLGSGFGVDKVREAPAVVAVAARRGATPAQVALAWLLAVSPRTLLIPGTSSVAHLEENLDAATLELSGEDLAEIG
ncbi:MAG TPA: oxidoreductase [Mycobacteriales bacterium]|jgi:aryl-alcohol dehydrogenase-like predicted oxidoreductase|nr:oxidoreductase [Mycobacteriales bacterium]